MEFVGWRNVLYYLAMAAALAMLFGGCASRGPDAAPPAPNTAAAARPTEAVTAAATTAVSTSSSSSPVDRAPNATVRSVTYREAAPNVASVPAGVALESAPKSKATAVVGTTTTAATGKPGTTARASAAPEKKTATASSRRGAKPVAATASRARSTTPTAAAPSRTPSANGWRYTYAVELDAGGMRNFGYAQDQGLAVLDRVLVEGDRLVVRRR